jgi:hypothetical protein
VLLELQTIKAAELKTIAQGEQVAALQIETDLENNARGGFGIILIPGQSAILCTTPKDKQEGHRAILDGVRAGLQVEFGSEPEVISTSVDAAFIAIQRGQCGAVYAEAKELGRVLQALRP